MTKSKSQLVNTGFTIIETLFVMAIAGIILLLVLEAIPTLTRNARNNQRKQDVAVILASVSQWELSHSGDMPHSSSNFLQFSKNKITYYDPSQIWYWGGANSPPLTTGINFYDLPDAATASTVTGSNWINTNIDLVIVGNYHKCDPTSSDGATVSGAGFNDVVALYAIETGSNNKASQCEQL